MGKARKMGEHEKASVLKVLNGNHSRHYVGKLMRDGRSKDASAKHSALKNRTVPHTVKVLREHGFGSKVMKDKEGNSFKGWSKENK